MSSNNYTCILKVRLLVQGEDIINVSISNDVGVPVSDLEIKFDSESNVYRVWVEGDENSPYILTDHILGSEATKTTSGKLTLLYNESSNLFEVIEEFSSEYLSAISKIHTNCGVKSFIPKKYSVWRRDLDGKTYVTLIPPMSTTKVNENKDNFYHLFGYTFEYSKLFLICEVNGLDTAISDVRDVLNSEGIPSYPEEYCPQSFSNSKLKWISIDKGRKAKGDLLGYADKDKLDRTWVDFVLNQVKSDLDSGSKNFGSILFAGLSTYYSNSGVQLDESKLNLWIDLLDRYLASNISIVPDFLSGCIKYKIELLGLDGKSTSPISVSYKSIRSQTKFDLMLLETLPISERVNGSSLPLELRTRPYHWFNGFIRSLYSSFFLGAYDHSRYENLENFIDYIADWDSSGRLKSLRQIHSDLWGDSNKTETESLINYFKNPSRVREVTLSELYNEMLDESNRICRTYGMRDELISHLQSYIREIGGNPIDLYKIVDLVVEYPEESKLSNMIDHINKCKFECWVYSSRYSFLKTRVNVLLDCLRIPRDIRIIKSDSWGK